MKAMASDQFPSYRLAAGSDHPPRDTFKDNRLDRRGRDAGRAALLVSCADSPHLSNM